MRSESARVSDDGKGTGTGAFATRVESAASAVCRRASPVNARPTTTPSAARAIPAPINSAVRPRWPDGASMESVVALMKALLVGVPPLSAAGAGVVDTPPAGAGAVLAVEPLEMGSASSSSSAAAAL